jgi:hypothetical protein
MATHPSKKYVEPEQFTPPEEMSAARLEVYRSREELKNNYGCHHFDYEAKCPVCEKKNFIRRPIDDLCMVCVLKQRNKARMLVIKD